jgi:hypothetical protein
MLKNSGKTSLGRRSTQMDTDKLLFLIGVHLCSSAANLVLAFFSILLVQRLEKQNAIRPKRGKWYPALESEQSLNGTVDGLLP